METKKKASFIYVYEHMAKSEEDIIEGWLIIWDTSWYVEEKEKRGERPKWWSPDFITRIQDHLLRYCTSCQIIQWLILVTSQSDIYRVAIV